MKTKEKPSLPWPDREGENETMQPKVGGSAVAMQEQLVPQCDCGKVATGRIGRHDPDCAVSRYYARALHVDREAPALPEPLPEPALPDPAPSPKSDLEARIDMATRYGGLGWRVFPCNPKPRNPGDPPKYYPPGWPNKATADPAEIRKLFEANPHLRTIAREIPENEIVIDVESEAHGKGNGLLVWEELAKDLGVGSFQDELCCRSRSGGRHIIFRVPPNETIAGRTHAYGLPIDILVRGSKAEHLPATLDDWLSDPWTKEPSEAPAALLEWVKGAQAWKAKPQTGERAKRVSEAGKAEEPEDIEASAGGTGESEKPAEEPDEKCENGTGQRITKADEARLKLLVDALARCGCRPRLRGLHKIVSMCPVAGKGHKDPDNFHAWFGADKRIMVKCHSKECTFDEIAEALAPHGVTNAVWFARQSQAAPELGEIESEGWEVDVTKKRYEWTLRGVIRDGDMGAIVTADPTVAPSLAVGIATGKGLWRWSCSGSRSVVLIDGLLGSEELRELLRGLMLGFGIDPEAVKPSLIRRVLGRGDLALTVNREEIENRLSVGSVLVVNGLDVLVSGSNRVASLRNRTEILGWFDRLSRHGATVVWTQGGRFPRAEKPCVDFFVWMQPRQRGERLDEAVYLRRAEGKAVGGVPFFVDLQEWGDEGPMRWTCEVDERVSNAVDQVMAGRTMRSVAESLGVPYRTLRRYAPRS